MNIVFDGNYLFHKTLGIFKVSKESELKQDVNLTELFKDKEVQAQFFRKLIIDFSNTIRLFDNVEKVVFVFDNPSWRKQKYPWYKDKGELSELDSMLKAEEEEGWTVFYNIMEKFSKHLKNKGFIISRLLDFEGDDLCFFYAKHYSKNNEKTLIVSGDKDLLQFLDENVCVYRNNSQSPAFFCIENDYLLELGEIISKKYKKTKVEIINPKKHTFVKMLIGDKGDNVSGVLKGLGVKTAEKIFYKMQEQGFDELDFCNVKYLLTLADLINKTCKNSEHSHFLIERLLVNIDVMWLDELVYNEHQLICIEKEIDEKSNSYTYIGEYNLTDILTK